MNIAVRLMYQRRQRIQNHQVREAQTSYRVVMFGEHPQHGVRSVRVSDLDRNAKSTHESWFDSLDWPSSGEAYDKIPRGEATVITSPENRVVLLRMSSQHRFASDSVVSHLKDRYNLHGHEFRDMNRG